MAKSLHHFVGILIDGDRILEKVKIVIQLFESSL